MRGPRPLVLAIAAGSLAAGAMTLSACGSTAAAGSPAAGSGGGTSHPSTNSSSGLPGTTGRTCVTSALKISLDTSAAGAAAGSSYVPLEFQNVSASACTLPDFPQVSFAAGPAGPDIGNPAVQEHATRAEVLTLAPGKFAHAWLQIVAAANYPASRCRPVTAKGLRVTLTTAASASFVARDFPACAKTLRGSSILAVFPIQAGRATRGTVP